MNKIEEIKRLKTLFDEGAISEDEFQMLKKKVISENINSNKNEVTDESKTQTIISEQATKKKEFVHENTNGKNPNSSNWLGEAIVSFLSSKIVRFVLFIGFIAIIVQVCSFFAVDISDEKAVLKDMQGTWIGYDHEAGVYTHYKLNISGKNFRGWISSSYTDDEPSWSSKPDVSGTFKLSPVQGYSNASGKYRNINFDDNDGNLLEARSLQNMIIYDDGQGLYVVGWASMNKK
ncbi:SHOCT domain-containing protein [Prolixibacteraceae bacterium Z1-6]|uniref:SHOCT domain-containing protein n=1 Tax=Draconibacterium aestuarii TaxID=2998507 RepID=A0A9X3F2M4_9BACT|nr:SHOCT domain-containing protein [Prolixibacteraceae bacterium Z1-6]